MTEMVENEVRGRGAAAHPKADRMEGRCHFELDTFRPHRIIVVDAVDAVVVEPVKPRELVLDCRNWPARRHRQHYRLETQRSDCILKLGYRLFRRRHWNNGDWREPILAFGENVSVILVV